MKEPTQAVGFFMHAVLLLDEDSGVKPQQSFRVEVYR